MEKKEIVKKAVKYWLILEVLGSLVLLCGFFGVVSADVVNGNFTTDLSGWSVNGFQLSGSGQSGNCAYGNAWAEDYGDTTYWIQQSVAINAGDTISYWCRSSCSGYLSLNEAYIFIYYPNGTMFGQYFAPSSWAQKTYIAPVSGNYLIKATARTYAYNSYGYGSTQVYFDTVSIIPGVVAPVSSFTASPTTGSAPLTVKFTDSSTGSPTDFIWVYGDGSYSEYDTEDSPYFAGGPTYTYYSPGDYTVKLYTWNDNGGDWENKTEYIHVTAPTSGIHTQFTGSPTSGAAPLTVKFTDSSTGNPTNFIYVYGDGYYTEYDTGDIQYSEGGPSHIYYTPGTYTVKCYASNATTGEWLNRTDYITVNNYGPPYAAFFASPETGPAPLTLQFLDDSSGSPTSWLFDFGDGTYTEYDTGDSPYFAGGPYHTYSTAGTYLVTMTCYNAYGSDSAALFITATAALNGTVTINALDALTTALIHNANVEVTGGTYINQGFDGSTSLSLAMGNLYYFNVTSPGYYPYYLQFTVTDPITINAALVQVGTAPAGKSSVDFQVNDYYTGSPIYAATSQLGTYGTLTDQQGIAHYLVDSSDTNLTWTISKTGYFAESGSVNILTSQTIPVRLRTTTGAPTATPTGTSSDLTTDEREMVRNSLHNAAQIIPGLFGILILMLFMAVMRRGGK